MNGLEMIKERLQENGGKWLGFKAGKNGAVIVRVRRRAQKYFYLPVLKYYNENRVIVGDRAGKEQGVAIRFSNHSFVLAPSLG